MLLAPNFPQHSQQVLTHAALPQQCSTDATSQEPTGEDVWLSVKAQLCRRDRLQLTSPKTAMFIRDCEFVSLGSYCAVARALQCIGIKKFSYPFDWVRSPLEGVIHCLEARFQGFLSYSSTFHHEGLKVYGGSKWGGSFWHHDPDAASTQTDMARRVDRFLGKAEVPASRMRVFIRAVNSSWELGLCIRLRQALCRALPEAQVYLLILVDFQTSLGPVGLSGDDGLIIWRVHESNHPTENGTGKWARTGKWTMEKQSEAYSQGLAFAIRLWSGEEGLLSHVQLVPDITALCQACDSFVGTDPSKELWLPTKIHQNTCSSDAFAGTNPTKELWLPKNTLAKSSGYRKLDSLEPSIDKWVSSQDSVVNDASASFVSRSASNASTPSQQGSVQSPTHLNLTLATMENDTFDSFGNENHSRSWPQAVIDAKLSQTSKSTPWRFPAPAQRAAQEARPSCGAWSTFAGSTSHVTTCTPTRVLPVKHLATNQYVQRFVGQPAH